MGMFKSILSKLGIGEKEDAAESSKPAATSTSPEARRPASRADAMEAVDEKMARAKRSSEMPMVDVVSKLEELAAANPEQLDWKVSIVDLLKLLGIDSGFEARKELAVELGIPEDQLDDSAEMNMWLHKAVLKKIAENGGNVPKELLD